MIEVWEKLDCESVGAGEIEAIEQAVAARFGDAAVESPMLIARLLADEGAALRHSEIMELWVRRFTDRPYEAEFRNLFRTSDIESFARSIRHVDNLHKRYIDLGDKDGLRLLRDEALDVKSALKKASQDKKLDARARRQNAEMAEWLTIWLQSPQLFTGWVTLRRKSDEFRKLFE